MLKFIEDWYWFQSGKKHIGSGQRHSQRFRDDERLKIIKVTWLLQEVFEDDPNAKTMFEST